MINMNINRGVILVMNDNKSRDIFYGVVAIATLIVAIIGATLAYFSITAGSNEGAINAKAASVSINYNDRFVIAQADQLIPSRFDIVQYFYEEKKDQIEDSTSNVCLDANNQQICSIYRFAVSVDAGDDPQTILAYLNTEDNGFTNLSYAVRKVNCSASGSGEVHPTDFNSSEPVVGPYNNCWLDVGNVSDPPDPDDLTAKFRRLEACGDSTDDQNDDCFTTDGTTKTYSTNNPQAKFALFPYDNNADANAVTINGGETNTYDVVIFLNEAGEQNNEQKMSYSGTIKVELNGVSGSENITGRATSNNP